MLRRGLKHEPDIEELTAWLDGELDPTRAQRVAERLAGDPDWQETLRQFQAVDRALDLLEQAEPPAGLTARIVSAVHRRRRVVGTLRLTGALAAAACAVLAAWLAWGFRPGRVAPPPAAGLTVLEQKTQQRIDENLRDILPEDRFIVQNLPLFRDYREVTAWQRVRDVADAETLSALAELEAGDL